jgi:hypothetical protein
MGTAGASNMGRFAGKRFTLPQLSSFARHSLFFCTGLVIASVPAAAQSIESGGLRLEADWGHWD